MLSDRYYLEDFEPDRYRTDPAPDNTLGIYRRDDASLLSIYTRLQLNDFYRADTRLPEVAFDQARAPVVRPAPAARRQHLARLHRRTSRPTPPATPSSNR